MCLSLFTSVNHGVTNRAPFPPEINQRTPGQTDGQFFFLFFGFLQRPQGFCFSPVSVRPSVSRWGCFFFFFCCHESRHASAAAAAAAAPALLAVFLNRSLPLVSSEPLCRSLSPASVLSSKLSLFSLLVFLQFPRPLASPYRTLHATTVSPARAGYIPSFGPSVLSLVVPPQTFLVSSRSPLNTR